jgi:hypothetical protein
LRPSHTGLKPPTSNPHPPNTQRYCKDNPGSFRNADAAYTLAFAIIMLNTDAHNPLAERRLAAPDFVSMNFAQTETGALCVVLDQGLVYERACIRVWVRARARARCARV